MVKTHVIILSEKSLVRLSLRGASPSATKQSMIFPGIYDLKLIRRTEIAMNHSQ